MLMIMNDKNEMVVANDWKDVPEPITRIGYKVSPTKCIIMEGFDSYLRIKEMVKGVNCKVNGMSKVFLFGRIGDKTAVVEFNFQTGKISNYVVDRGKEYYGRLQADPLSFSLREQKPISKSHWKKGVVGKDQKIYVANV